MRAGLDLLFVTPFPPSPPAIGAQRRMEGLMSALSRRHRVACLSGVGPDHDAGVTRRATSAYCDEVVLVPGRRERGLPKRLLQLRALLSRSSFERLHFSAPGLSAALDRLLRRRRFDAVCLEFPFLAHLPLRKAPAGSPPPRIVLDEHNVEHDLARQSRDASDAPLRRLHHSVNWRKIQREELAAWRTADGVAFVSEDDAARARSALPALRAVVVPNGVDVEHFRPGPHLPRPDGRTIVFFGTLDYFPNLDGVRWLLDEIWPLLERSHAGARLKVIGPRPAGEILRRRSPRIEVTGAVDDLRPHLAEAAAIVAPLRVGGGTRLKIVEAMAMGKAIVSTRLGAEGIAAADGRDLLLADEPGPFALAVGRLLDDPALAAALGGAARALAEREYAWSAAGERLERLLLDVVDGPPRP